MQIFPVVQSIEYKEGTFKCPEVWTISCPPSFKLAQLEWMRFASTIKAGNGHLHIKTLASLSDQAYQLTISPSGVTIESSTASGAFYAIKTLIQLMKQSPTRELPCLVIIDAPQLKLRGYMLDISRNKIPEVDTIKKLIDLLADLKYNHLELYVEGFSFRYPSFADLYEGKSALTTHEYDLLELYAKQRFIDLVPCHNGLGHMTQWLARPEYNDLAIIKDGMEMWGAHRPASTINPLDPRSAELVKKFYKDALIHSTSQYFHINMDEPYELGHGATKEVAERIGVGQIYLNYVREMVSFIHSYERTPLIWGDVLNHYPATISRLPKKIIFVDWGYDHNYPFHITLERLSRLGVTFIAAPGTSTWNSITGRTQDMLTNIHHAADHAIRNKGLGLLLTDWGDNGHMQPMIVSYPAIVYAALESWRQSPENIRLMKSYIDDFILQDHSHSFGQLLLDAGNYYRHEPEFTYNSTQIMAAIWHTDEALHSTQRLIKWQQINSKHPYADKARYLVLKDEIGSLITRAKAIPHLAKRLHHHESQFIQSLELVDALIDLISLAGDFPPEVVHHRSVKVGIALQRLQTKFKTQWLRFNKVGELASTLSQFDRAIRLAHAIAIETDVE